MSSVFTIARRDMLGYLAAPKAGAVFWFFLLLMGFFFFSFIGSFAEYQRQAVQTGQEAPGIDQLVRALFQNLHFILLLVIPAVSMGSFTDEKKNHSIRLLQTAPVRSSEIVIGKFLALAGIMAIVLICSAVFPMFLVQFGTPDINMILTSYLGLFLLMCSQLAFGIWISSMTSNQFLAFLFTMFGLFLLLILNWIAPNIAGGGPAEGAVKYLASTTHFESFLKGVITVADVTYFICFSALFLFFTNVVVDSQRWR